MFKPTLIALAFGSMLVIASQPSANAMVFGSADAGNNTLIITMQGKIEPGDTVKLNQFLKTIPATAHIGAWAMNSQGGLVNEAVQLGEIILKNGAMTVLPDNVTCASACFWLFAAGQSRMMVSTAQLGVHGTKDERGREAPESTVDSARFAKQIGIPDSVIVAMVTTPPNEITWLSPRQLTEMGVKIVPPSEQTAMASPSSPTYTPPRAAPPTYAPAPVSPPTPAPVDPTQAFDEGQTERRAYEDWMASLPEGSQFKDGALYWASVRSTKKAAIGCVGPGYTGKPEEKEWAAGCLNAKAKLDPTDYRRLTNASYRDGWNSVPETTNDDVPPKTSPMVASNAPATAFMNGYADRRAYEAWVEALPEGQYKEGAYYWASVRSTPKASMGCYGPGDAGAPDQQDWASGCLAAKSRLDPTDRRRNSEPDYKAGWNSASREIEGPKPWNK